MPSGCQVITLLPNGGASHHFGIFSAPNQLTRNMIVLMHQGKINLIASDLYASRRT